MRIRVSAESLILVAICMVDMLSTLYFVLRGVATEQNPLMAACFGHSPGMFVMVKMLSFVPFIVAIELYRRKNQEFALRACRCAIVLYLATYVTMTLGTNVI